MKQLHTHTNESQDGKMAQIVLNTCIFFSETKYEKFHKIYPLFCLP